MDSDEIKRIIWISGLKNAVDFNGKPSKKAVMGKIMAERSDLKSQTKTIINLLDQIIEEITKLDIKEQKTKLLQLDPTALEKKEIKEEKKELPQLPNLSNYEKIVMRLAPYPSGALHIGNARMVILNDEYVKKHNGELILFFDDTIGSPQSLRDSPKAKYVLPEAYDLIEEGLKWLNINYTKVYYKSDRLEIFYKYCEKLISDNIAYVCFCTGNEFRERYKSKKKKCPHRAHSIEKNLEEWNNMLKGKYKETEAVVRLKTGMDQKDPALRDQIIMRISEAEHPRVGKKYTIWPMLEFSWAIDDYLIGVTHILRGADLIKEDFIEDFIWSHFKWKIAEFLHYGRLNFPDMKLSKTEARNNIQKGIYDGWEDPRTWSLQSLENRGIKPIAIRETLLELGMSMTGITFSVNWLYSKNKDLIDEISDRYFYVEDPVSVIIDKVPFDEFTSEPLKLPSNPKKGKRKIKCNIINHKLELFISLFDARKNMVGQIIRLKDLFNIKIVKIDENNNIYAAEFHSRELNREYPIIQWVLKEGKVKVSILKPNGLITTGYGELNLLKIPMRKPIQFERYGFVNPIRLTDNDLFCYFTHS